MIYAGNLADDIKLFSPITGHVERIERPLMNNNDRFHMQSSNSKVLSPCKGTIEVMEVMTEPIYKFQIWIKLGNGLHVKIKLEIGIKLGNELHVNQISPSVEKGDLVEVADEIFDLIEGTRIEVTRVGLIVEDSNELEFVTAPQVSVGFSVMAGETELLSIRQKDVAGNF